jgi:hypothetical protein
VQEAGSSQATDPPDFPAFHKAVIVIVGSMWISVLSLPLVFKTYLPNPKFNFRNSFIFGPTLLSLDKA